MICRNVIGNVNISGNGSINIVQSVVCGNGVEESSMTAIRNKGNIIKHIDNIVSKIPDAYYRNRFAALVPYIVRRFGGVKTLLFLDYLYNNGFFSAPASTRWHLAYAGGLLAHSINVAEQMIELSQRYSDVSVESCAVIGLFHDICKMDAYVYDKTSDTFKWNKKRLADVTNDSEHGELSIKRISAFLPLSDAEAAAIEWHMGLYDWRLNPTRNADDATADEVLSSIKSNRKRYEDACRAYPTVKLAHIADMIASQLVEKD